jgi:[ribosomal protein S5]-alanine N-acetyltransferase
MAEFTEKVFAYSLAMIFETDRLIVRRWTLEDAEAALRMYGDVEVMRYLGRNGAGAVIGSVEEMKERLGKSIEKYRDEPGRSGYIYGAVVPKGESDPVGTVLLKPLELSSGEAAEEIEIGWHLARSHWGQGYGTEAGRGVMEYGFQHMPVEELHAIAYPENTASLRIMQKLGMEYVGSTDRYYGVTAEHYIMRK